MTDAGNGLLLSVPDGVPERLAAALRALDKKGRSIAMAESCTAGLVASAVSAVPRLGHVLECGFVVYTDGAKTRLLGVPPTTLQREGAVSEAVARSMAEGALERAASDLAVSVTGFAGPGDEADEEGLVHFALARTGRSTSHRVEHFGARGVAGVRLAALDVVIDLLNTAGAER